MTTTDTTGAGWRPIETAPKEGWILLGWFKGCRDMQLGYWHKYHGQWRGHRDACWFGATHWHPLPEAHTGAEK